MKNIIERFKNLPSFVWIILIVVGIIALIGGIITIFWAVATIEGIASIVILIAGIIAIWTANSFPSKPDLQKSSNFMVAVGIVFFALMGMAIDQTGNFIYNKPIEIFYCSQDEYLNRGVDVTNPLPGRTDITQEFVCINKTTQAKRYVDMGSIILVRFVEYIIIGYALRFFVPRVQLFIKRKNSIGK